MRADARRLVRLPLRHGTPRTGPRMRGHDPWLGSVAGRTLREGRRTIVAVAALLGTFVLAGSIVMATTYGTPQARAELGLMAFAVPESMRGVYGTPLNVDTTGGFISWHYGPDMALVLGLWSIVALAGTLAAEARRGSLEIVVATGRGRARIALEKVGGHVAALAVAAGGAGLLAWAGATVFGIGPRDAIAPGAAAAFALGLVVRALAAGSLAFALAPLLGRGAAAAIAGVVMVAGYLATGYRALLPALDPVAQIAWWSWGTGHIPLAGATDWAGIGATAAFAGLWLTAGVLLFMRRDIGVTIELPLPRLPRRLRGLRGPWSRATVELAGQALAWGAGLAAYGWVMTAVSGALIEMLAGSPALTRIWRSLIPGVDITTAGGYLQLAFVELGCVFFGLLAASLVHARWQDETSGRLELLLATPLGRVRWLVATAGAIATAIGIVTALLAFGIGTGVAALGQEAWTPAAGTLVLGIYGAALAGVGIAAGGIAGPRIAAPTVLALAIVTFVLDLLAPLLRLPAWIGELALTTHLGTPMTGAWDPLGVSLCVVLAVGGTALGAWGIARRDLGA